MGQTKKKSRKTKLGQELIKGLKECRSKLLVVNCAYLAGMKHAHRVALGCLPIPCGQTNKQREGLKRLGMAMGIPIQAIEKEIKLFEDNE